MNWRIAVKQLLRRVGLEVLRFDPKNVILEYDDLPIAGRMKLFRHYGINLVLDVGANIGQYGRDLRCNGYAGRIVSFEPLTSALARLQAAAQNDPHWQVVPLALGDQNTRAKLNIAGNSESSSLLEMLPRHREAAPDSRYIGAEEITVRTLDSVFNEYHQADDRTYLKIDAQGYEPKILAGARESLPNIVGLQMELSFVPLYRDQMLFLEMVHLLQQSGFRLMSLEPVFRDEKTGELLQVDGIFFREAS